MRNPTHVVVGMCAALGLAYVAQTPIELPAGAPELVAGAVAGLLPNLDHLQEALEESPHPVLKGLGRRLARIAPGGLTHSALIVLPLAAALGGLGWALLGRPGLLVATVAGVLSHLLLDLFVNPGLQLYAPLSHAWCAFPPWERLRPDRESQVDALVFAAGLLALFLVLAFPLLYPYAVRVMQGLGGL